MRNDINMLSGRLTPAIIRFTIPVILTTLLQNLFNTADLIVIGQYCGSLKVAAVTATGSLTSLLIALFSGLSLGAGLTVAKAIGSRQDEDISDAVHTAIPIAVFGGLLLSVVGIIFSPSLLKLINTPPEVLALSSVYMRIYFAGIIFTVIYNFCSAILRATGNTKSPLYYLTIAGVLNVLLNIFFVTVCKLDVVGVALATVLSQLVAATLVVTALMRRTDSCKLSLNKIRIYKKPMVEILRIGLPAGIQSSLFSISNVITTTALNSFESAAILSGNGSSQSIEVFTDAIGIGFTQATPNFIAQNLGAKQYKRIKDSYMLCLACSAIFVFVTSFIMYLFGRPLLGLYITDSEEAIMYGLTRMKYLFLMSFLMATMTVSTGALQGLGYSIYATVITLITGCAFRIVWIYTIFQIPQFHTLDCMYIIYPLSWVLTTVIEGTLFLVLLKKKILADKLIQSEATS